MPGRIDHLAGLVAPASRLVWGAGLIPALTLQGDWRKSLALTACFAILARLAGKRIDFRYFGLMVGSIIFFNLLSPFGRVLARIGPFTLSQGALEDGLNKGLVIAGLVFISLFSVSRELRFGGRFGELLTRTFHYYELLLRERKTLKLKALILSVDRLLERLFDPTREDPLPPPGPRPRSGVLAWLLIVASWAVAGSLLFLRF